jgi:glycosyltransferase involved in cell wall biosynthesis
VSALTACTIVSKNYLPFARVLARSFLECHPGSRFITLLVDRIDDCFDPDGEPFEVMCVEELENIPQLEQFLFKYTVLELNTAVKPYFLEFLLAQNDVDKLVYLDPDIQVFRALTPIEQLLETQSAVLLPHLTAPIDSPGLPDELTILRAGAYNLGFLGVSDCEETANFLRWWQSRVFDQCVVRIEKGLFVDQKWIDLVPGLFEGVAIVRDPGYDVAYWNLHERTVSLESGEPVVNCEPLYFYHFSGINPEHPNLISKHQTRFSWADLGDVQTLFKDYAKLVLDHGWMNTKDWPYAFACFDNGVPIPSLVRRIFLNRGPAAERFGNPFNTNSASSFYSWLMAPSPRVVPSVTRLLRHVHGSRADLVTAFPDPDGEHMKEFAEWLSVHAEDDFDLAETWIAPILPVLDGRVRPSLMRRVRTSLNRVYNSVFARRMKDWAKRRFGEAKMKRLRVKILGAPPPDPIPIDESPVAETKRLGINVAGYIQTESGVGEGVRAMIRALELAQIPHGLTNLDFNVISRMDDDSFSQFSEDANFPVNLFAVNADQVPELVTHVGSARFEGRYNIGYWAWELDVFPSQWLGAFRLFDEIWTPSRFCVDVLSSVAPIPVRRVPHAVEVSARPETQRDRFELPEDRFLFLFAFDFLSFWERKNPLAVVRAFRRAFADRDDVGLVLKSINAKHDPERLDELEREAEGLPLWHIHDYLDRQEVFDLMNVCDAYVSLHRAEGFGLTIAEAMSLGKPVISTDYSGSTDFVTLASGLPVRYVLKELGEDCGPYPAHGHWADPDEEHAAEQMSRLVTDPQLAKSLGRKARQQISEYCGREAVAALLQARLENIVRLRPQM